MRLILASGSPRRRALLGMLGIPFEVMAADIDETPRVGEVPIAYTDRLARAKVDEVAGRIGDLAGRVVCAADTIVDIGGQIVGKPVDDDDARRILRALSGRTHLVHTTVVARSVQGTFAVVVSTEVGFARLSEAGIEWYLGLNDHRDKAGAYGLQSAGAVLVHRLTGSPTNVIGLPLPETVGVLRAAGLTVTAG